MGQRKMGMLHGAQAALDPERRYYDVYERLPDGTLIWIAALLGRQRALAGLKEISAQTENEVFLMDLYDDKVIARKNCQGTDQIKI